MSDRRDRIQALLRRQQEEPDLPHFGDWRDLLRGLRGPAGQPGARGSSGAPGRTGDTGVQGLPGELMPMMTSFGSYSEFGLGVPMAAMSLGAPVSTVWPAANQAIYLPVRVTETFLATQLAIRNGATASGNVDVGIYDANGNRVISTGSQAQVGTSTLQIFTIATTQLLAGLYWLAQVLDNGTGTLVSVSMNSVADGRAWGMFQEASAFPLPVSATFAAVTSARIPAIYVARAPGVL